MEEMYHETSVNVDTIRVAIKKMAKTPGCPCKNGLMKCSSSCTCGTKRTACKNKTVEVVVNRNPSAFSRQRASSYRRKGNTSKFNCKICDHAIAVQCFVTFPNESITHIHMWTRQLNWISFKIPLHFFFSESVLCFFKLTLSFFSSGLYKISGHGWKIPNSSQTSQPRQRQSGLCKEHPSRNKRLCWTWSRSWSRWCSWMVRLFSL